MSTLIGFDKPRLLCTLPTKKPPTTHSQVTTVPISVITSWHHLFTYFLYFLTVLRLLRISIYLVCTLFVNILYLVFTNIVAWINGPFFVIFKNNYKFTRTEKDSKKMSHLSFTQYSPMVTSEHNYTKISEAEIWYGAICVFIVLCHLITYVNFYNWHCNRDTEPLYTTLKTCLVLSFTVTRRPLFPSIPDT